MTVCTWASGSLKMTLMGCICVVTASGVLHFVALQVGARNLQR